MQYLGLILWFLFLGLCVYGYDIFWIILFLLFGYLPSLFIVEMIRVNIRHLYYQWLKKRNPERYHEKQLSIPYNRRCLRMAELAKTEEERKQWLDKAEL